MQLTGFDFKSVVFLILSFFGSCWAFTPPDPITIHAPESVVTARSVFEPGSLKTKIENAEKLVLVYKDYDQRELMKIVYKRNDKKIADAIQLLKKNWSGNDISEVSIEGATKEDLKVFKEIIEALKENKIYKYKLISTPE